MVKFDILVMQKKGQARVNSKITYLVGALIVIVLATQLAPDMFTGIAGLNTTADGGVVPNFVPVVLYVIVGAGIVFLIWNAFGNK